MTELDKKVYMLGAMEKLVEENKRLKKEVRRLKKYKRFFHIIKKNTYFPYPYDSEYYFTFSTIALEREKYLKIYEIVKNKKH